MSDVTLRAVADDDLPIFFELQADPVSVAMAGVNARDRATFDHHLAKIRTDPEVLLRAIVYRGSVVGNAVSFLIDGHREIGYWIDQAFWGQGIGSAALAQLLEIETRRPLYGHVLATNLGSRRVLERNGFVFDSLDGDAIMLVHH